MIKTFLCLLGFFFSTACFATEQTVLRLGVLAFGTVNWELTSLQKQGVLDNAPYRLEITPLASPQAGKIALQSKAVDIIVADWIWTSRQRWQGSDYTFHPYSNTAGALIINKNSGIQHLKDLQGKKLGIAGGALDKNWLLLQTLANQQQLALDDKVEKVFAAPPLLNQQLISKRADAIINYWHFAARLEAAGYRQLLNGQQILQQLGIKEQAPSLGYVFTRSWAEQHQSALNQFLKDARAAKDRLCDSDKAWAEIAHLTKAKTSAVENTLRQRYCQGRVIDWGQANISAAEKVYTLIRSVSGNKLTGDKATIAPGAFWIIQ